MSKEQEQHAPTDLLRTVEGMLRYIEPECNESEDKTVFLVACDYIDEENRPTLGAICGDTTRAAISLAAAMAAEPAIRALVQGACRIYEGYQEMEINAGAS